MRHCGHRDQTQVVAALTILLLACYSNRRTAQHSGGRSGSRTVPDLAQWILEHVLDNRNRTTEQKVGSSHPSQRAFWINLELRTKPVSQESNTNSSRSLESSFIRTRLRSV